MIKKGDTLVEVCLAIGIFSMVAIAITSVLIGSTSGAQTALETTLAREEIDAQAESLRFIQSSYVVSANSSDKLAMLWRTITNDAIKISDIRESDRDEILQYHPATCENLLNNDTIKAHAFVINPRVMSGSVDGSYVKLNAGNNFFTASTYPRLVYSGNTSQLVDTVKSNTLNRVEGIYVIAVKDPETTGIVDVLGEKGDDMSVVSTAAYYDFYIRTCWYGMGTDEPSTISTVIRLNDPDAMLEIGDLSITLTDGANTTSRRGRKIVLPTPSKTGYKFGGWCEGNLIYGGTSCNGNTYKGGQTVFNPETGLKEMTLIAIWKKKFDVFYGLNNGVNGPNSPQTCYQGEKCTISSTKPTRENFKFVEWCNADTDACGLKPNDVLFEVGNNNTADVHLKATWEFSEQYLHRWNSCGSLALGESVKLEDKRDGERYYVSKLADGRCWMLGNLRLGSSTPISLTPDDTNIDSNYTLPAGLNSGSSSNESGAIYAKDKSNYSNGYGLGGQFMGVYYNYCAASAETVCGDNASNSATFDICPAGWRMPTSSEYRTLLDGYSGNTSDFKNYFAASLSGGFYGETVLRGKGVYGTAWSSTRLGTREARAIYVTSGSDVQVNYAAGLRYMLSVRCVKK